jgi:hypothetical protein
VLFNEPLDATSLDHVNLLVGTSPVAASRVLSNGNQTLTVYPAALLSPNTTFTLSVADVKDMAGNALATPVTSTFTTGSLVDNNRPSALTYNPPQGAGGVPVSTTLQVTFDEAMSPLNGNIQLYVDATGVLVPVTLTTVSSDRRTFTMTPTAPLSAGTIYRWIVSYNTFTDLAGNGALTNTGFWVYFTTTP